ncbi:hypothetical protein N657DRAFT_649677 [Parathielavia appendiculata]|uniref:Uncharacterized protein n=1 Tax=Parathielavia appendiculata TaxID=2587402 RepID=A0AAN6TTT5_9PEZI|nr:hypothetical protein N657DRAFT_649677 [Parathielavia appendiculata]
MENTTIDDHHLLLSLHVHQVEGHDHNANGTNSSYPSQGLMLKRSKQLRPAVRSLDVELRNRKSAGPFQEDHVRTPALFAV